MSVEPRCYFGEMALMISDWTSCFRLDPSDEQTIRLPAIWSPILGDQVVGHVEDSLCSPTGLAGRIAETHRVSRRSVQPKNLHTLDHRRSLRRPRSAFLSARNRPYSLSRSMRRLEDSVSNHCQTHRPGSRAAGRRVRSLSRSALRREPRANPGVSTANAGFRAPSVRNTKGSPTAAKGKAPSYDPQCPMATSDKLSHGDRVPKKQGWSRRKWVPSEDSPFARSRGEAHGSHRVPARKPKRASQTRVPKAMRIRSRRSKSKI